MTISRYFLVAALAITLIFFVGKRAFAQPEMSDAPDQGSVGQDANDDSESAQDQGDDQGSEQTPGDDDGANANVAVPVPGGGSVQADEPQEEPPTQIPPNENWSTRAINPGMQGDSPQGP